MSLARGCLPRSLATFTLVIGLVSCGGSGGSHQTDYVPQFDDLWETFDKNYFFFEYKHIDWPAAKAPYRPRAAAARSEDDLIAAVKDMLSVLHDRHVWLQSSSGSQFYTFDPHYFVNWNKDVWLQYISRASWVQDKTNLGHATFSGVPYIAIGQWSLPQMSIDDLDAVLELFRNSSGLIVDVRMNGGG